MFRQLQIGSWAELKKKKKSGGITWSRPWQGETWPLWGTWLENQEAESNKSPEREKLLSAFLSTFLPWQQRRDVSLTDGLTDIKQQTLLRSVNIL